MIETKITCRGFPCTDSIKDQVKRRVESLEKFHGRVSHCEVTISQQHRNKSQGKIFHVRVLLRIPQAGIVVNREPEMDHAHEDFAVALRDAFRATKRILEDKVRIKRGFTKTHRIAEPRLSAG